MKNHFISIILIILIISVSCKFQVEEKMNWPEFIDEQIQFAVDQYREMDAILPDSLAPRTFENGELITSGTSWWCSGFYPGSLWYLYEYTGDESLKEIAERRTMALEKEMYNRGTHDLGFMLFNSFGNGYRLTNSEEYKEILLTGAESLISRYNDKVGCIKSWDYGDWQFPVIIDNMMNLEYLFWASDDAGRKDYYTKSVSHADKTMKNHYRPDYSSFHLVDYDTLTGEVIGKKTVQGYSDESTWARGQAWGFYGFVSVYRITGNERYFEHAVHIASFLLNHPNLPLDGIPYWDFDAPNLPEVKRDASAGAIMASAFLDLSAFVEENDSANYVDQAKKIIRSLATEYRAVEAGENGNFIVKHSVGHYSAGIEVDVPLSYADYYFIEAILRLKKIIS